MYANENGIQHGGKIVQQIMISKDRDRVSVSPGSSAEFNVTVQNLTTLLDDATVSVTGIEPGWVQVIPSHAPVFAQGQASVRAVVQPPADADKAVAGIYPLQIVGKLQELAGQEASIGAELEVQFRGDYRIELGKGRAASSQEVTFELVVHNEANAPLALQCSGDDPQQAFWYKFDPFQVNADPGKDAVTTLTLRVRQAIGPNQTGTSGPG